MTQNISAISRMRIVEWTNDKFEYVSHRIHYAVDSYAGVGSQDSQGDETFERGKYLLIASFLDFLIVFLPASNILTRQ